MEQGNTYIPRCSKLGSVGSCVIGGFFGVVLGGCAVVARCSVGRGVVDWSISVVFLFNVARKSSLCGKSGLRNTWPPQLWLCRSGQEVLCRFGVVLNRLGGDISGSLGVAAGNRVAFRKIGAISS